MLPFSAQHCSTINVYHVYQNGFSIGRLLIATDAAQVDLQADDGAILLVPLEHDFEFADVSSVHSNDICRYNYHLPGAISFCSFKKLRKFNCQNGPLGIGQ